MYWIFLFSLLSLFACLFLYADPTTDSEEDLVIDSAYFRRLSGFHLDTGTIHVFLKNMGAGDLEIQDAFINNLSLSHQDKFLWYKIHPNPIPAKKTGELTVRLRRSFNQLDHSGDAKLRLITTDSKELSASIPLTSHPFCFTFVGFDDSLDTVFLYMKNSGKRSLSVDKVFLSTEDVTRKCRIPERKIGKSEKKLITIKLDKALIRGEFITVKVTTKEGIIAQSRVRALNDFPIAYEAEDLDTELLMDESSFKWEGSEADSEGSACHILDCPMHIGDDHSTEAMLTNSRNLRLKIDEIEREFPLLPGYVAICRVNMYNGCTNFGQTGDIIRVNPTIALLPSFRPYLPADMDGNPVQYLTTFAKEASEPKPLQTIIATASRDSARNLNPTPELQRLLVYYAVSRGSKGIFYRAWKDLLKDKPELLQELKRVNGELQVLKRFLKIGEPVPLAECTDADVEANTILAGNRGIVLILINQKPIFSERTEDGIRAFFAPKMNFEAVVHVPKWMRIKEVYEAGEAFKRLKYTRRGTHMVIKIDQLDFTKQIVFTTNSDDYDYDGDKDGISDIEEVVVYGTHPAIPNVDTSLK